MHMLRDHVALRDNQAASLQLRSSNETIIASATAECLTGVFDHVAFPIIIDLRSTTLPYRLAHP
jgi:hypothetical protein